MSPFWTIELAQAVARRHGSPYVISDWKTPSGHIHVGALRGVVLHDAVARTLREQGRAVRFIYGFDDFDEFKKVPSSLDPSYEQFLGRPHSQVPVPNKLGKPSSVPVSPAENYGRHFAAEFEHVYRLLGVESETLYTSELYAQGALNEPIRLALDRADLIRHAYESVITDRSAARTATPFELYPLNVLCEACGRINNTQITEWDGSMVTYRCEHADCSHRGRTSPFDGQSKLPWKVEWAAKFFVFRTDLEGAGKDHYTRGGSRDVANEIFRTVFMPHLDVDHAKLPIDLFYEWLYLDGKKMATSKGVGVKASDIAVQLPSHLVRFLLLRTRPERAVQYDASPEAVPRLFDQYDQYLQLASKDSAGDHAQIVRLAQPDPEQKIPQYTMRFSSVAYLLQLPGKDVSAIAEQEKEGPLTQEERVELGKRIAAAERWLESAPTDQRIVLQEHLPELALSADGKAFIRQLANELSSDVLWDGRVLHETVHQVRKAVGIEPRLAFQAIYQLFLGRDSGPQVGWFFAALDREFVLERLREASR